MMLTKNELRMSCTVMVTSGFFKFTACTLAVQVSDSHTCNI